MPISACERAGAALLIVAFAAGACARPHVAVTALRQAPRDATLAAGTIVAIRPVVLRSPKAGGTDASGTIFGAIGTPVAVDPADDRVVEFIVREDTGQAVSVVQDNAGNLVAGERVRLTGTDRVRLVHGTAASPAGA